MRSDSLRAFALEVLIFFALQQLVTLGLYYTNVNSPWNPKHSANELIQFRYSARLPLA